MRRRRRRHYKRNRRFPYGVLTGALLILLVGIGTFVWTHRGKESDLQKEDAQIEPAKPEEGLRTDIKQPEEESDSSRPQKEEPEAEPQEPPEPEPTAEELLQQEIEAVLADMTMEEKICQMFILTPEQLTGVSGVTAAGDTTKSKLKEYPVGGLIYFSSNLVSEDQTREMLENTKAYGKEIEGLPLFLCIDEEGGRVARIGRNAAFSVEQVKPMGQINNEEEAYQAGMVIGSYLCDLGFNVDFAPDADVLTNERNTVIGDRSFGSDPERVTRMASAVSDGLHAEGVLSAFKHFPGHGATEADTHEGYAYTEKTYEELRAAELIPFAAAKECGVDMVMVAHISLPNVVGDSTPSSLSHKMITEILRGDLGFEGLVVTDSMSMGAVTEHYSSGEAAAKAVEAGADLLLMPKNFQEAFQGIRDAVSSGRITEERIEESLQRILRVKLSME